MNNTNREAKLTIHRESDRGVAEHGWLSSRFSFSFANWYDETRMGFGALRVINDDAIISGSGFGTHSHNNMEIITIVNTGTLEHKDSLGNIGTVSANEVQVMSAGSGIMHSEYNGGNSTLQLFQIWISSNTKNVAPRYDQRIFEGGKIGETLLVAPMGHNEALNIHQDAYISRIIIDSEHSFEYKLKQAGHGVYFFVISGALIIEGVDLNSRDAIGVEDIDTINISSKSKAELLAIEVPMR